MKIIVSPSKTMDLKLYNSKFKSTKKDEDFRAKASKITDFLIDNLRSFDREYIAKKMKLKDDLLDKTVKNIADFDKNSYGTALFSYTGTVFNQLTIDTYDEDSLSYANDNVRILSALFGSLKAMERVKEYRLDMNMNMFDKSLYDIWKELLNEYYSDEIIFNLASSEYSKMIKQEMIDVDFLMSGKRVAYHSKVARGCMLEFMIKNKVQDINLLKKESFNGYVYNEDLSNERKLVYTK